MVSVGVSDEVGLCGLSVKLILMILNLIRKQNQSLKHVLFSFKVLRQMELFHTEITEKKHRDHREKSVS